MLEKILADMEKAVGDLRTSLEAYLKAIGDLKNKNWAADVAKARSKAMLAVTVAKAQLKLLENAMKKLGGSCAGRKEISDKLMRISAAQERLILAVKKADEVLEEDLVKSA